MSQSQYTDHEDSIKDAKKLLEIHVKNNNNVLLKPESIKNIPPNHKVTVLSKKFSMHPDDKEVYIQSGDPEKPKKCKYALMKKTLMWIASEGGIQLNFNYCGRTDSGKDKNYMSWKMVGGVLRLDGSQMPLQGEYDLPFDVIEEQILMQKDKNSKRYEGKKWWDNKSASEKKAYIESKAKEEFLNFKRHGAARCETGALLRLIRGCFPLLKDQYTWDELQKEFVVARLVFQPDFNDPMTKAAALQLSFEGMKGVYGGGGQLPAPAPGNGDTINADYREVPEGDPPENEEPEPEAEDEKDPEEPVNKIESQVVDFENSDDAEQERILRAISSQLQIPIDEVRFSKDHYEKRPALFRYLLNKQAEREAAAREKKEPSDDIPV